MMLRAIQVLIIATGILFGLSAAADPWKDEAGQGYHHERDWHKHKRWHKDRYDREDEAEEDDDNEEGYRHRVGPPPWAPAYGYRRMHHDDRAERDDGYDQDRDRAAVEFKAASDRIGISSGQCNRAAVGTVVGGIVGGVIGHNLLHTRDKNLATVAGVLIGAVVGNRIGRNMDNADVNCTNQILERAPDGQVVRWKNPDSGYQYSITPYKTYKRADGRYCRDYIAVVRRDKVSKYREVACRTEKGIWKQQ